MKTSNACVLLSGGMDSVAAVHWTATRYENVRAIGFDYGQPHRDAELTIAGGVARRMGIPYQLVALADAFLVRTGLLDVVRDHDDDMGIDPAFVTNRNSIFLNVAAAHACAWFPNGNIDLVFGSTMSDHRFPDCRNSFLTELASLLRKGCARQIDIVRPFATGTKGAVIAVMAHDAAAMEDMTRSWSCYRGERGGPCGRCTACVEREHAFAAFGLEDRSSHPTMSGGDPSRKIG